MRATGIEPARSFDQGFLRPSRLPLRHARSFPSSKRFCLTMTVGAKQPQIVTFIIQWISINVVQFKDQLFVFPYRPNAAFSANLFYLSSLQQFLFQDASLDVEVSFEAIFERPSVFSYASDIPTSSFEMSVIYLQVRRSFLQLFDIASCILQSQFTANLSPRFAVLDSGNKLIVCISSCSHESYSTIHGVHPF